jgi:hypothetical protein
MTARAAIAFLLVTVAAPLARAQAVLHEEERTPFATSQRWAIELRFGLYRPDIDSEFKGAMNPHQDFFGSKRRLMFQMEGDYQFFNRFGTAAVSLSAGYFRETARSFVENSADPTERSGDTTALTLYPLTAGLVYRFDVPVRRLNIPLVPYAKAGLTYTIWSISNGNGDVATTATGGRGRGGTPGWYGGVGLSFLLNFLDPTAARTFDSDSGVNRTYLFFELVHMDGSGLGRKNVLHVGDDTWFAGLMFEF